MDYKMSGLYNIIMYYMCYCFPQSEKENYHELVRISNDIDVMDATWENAIPYVPSVGAGKVIKVYDGDTITIATKLKSDENIKIDKCRVYRFSVRLNGIDTPEMKSKNENEKKHAILAKHFLSDRILGEVVRLENVSIEKFGRVLADVYHNDVNMNELMITNNYAVAYQGGTKEIPDMWKEDIELEDYHKNTEINKTKTNS